MEYRSEKHSRKLFTAPQIENRERTFTYIGEKKVPHDTALDHQLEPKVFWEIVTMNNNMKIIPISKYVHNRSAIRWEYFRQLMQPFFSKALMFSSTLQKVENTHRPPSHWLPLQTENKQEARVSFEDHKRVSYVSGNQA